MINRISEIPFWGPEEQIRRFINQHDEMSELYDDALRRLVPPVSEEEIKTLDTEDKKKNKLKERIVALFEAKPIGQGTGKFIIDGISYIISADGSQVSWTNSSGISKSAPRYKTFYLDRSIENAINGEKTIKTEYVIGDSQVTWKDAFGREQAVDIINNGFTLDDIQYTIQYNANARRVNWSESGQERTTPIFNRFTLEDGIDYVRDFSDNTIKLSLSGENKYFSKHVGEYLFTQQTITQQRLDNLDDIYQKQLIWSYGLDKVDDAYFYQDWCPIGDYTQDESDPKWQMDMWGEVVENLRRTKERTFDYKKFKGYQKSILPHDEMPEGYDASEDEHARDIPVEDPTNLDIDTLRHNIMRSYLEVSEWLGDGATAYGSHNGYVSRKMSLAWLFNAVKALINWKLDHMPTYGEVDIHPLVVDEFEEIKRTPDWQPTVDVDYFKRENGRYVKFQSADEVLTYDGAIYVYASGIKERFLNEGELSTQGIDYKDYQDLDQRNGHCAIQPSVRATHPDKDGVLTVYGNEYHYGERGYFYTHNSFIGECRFFHNARFLGQATFDKEIVGTVMRSRWADLAEYRKSDKQYEPGTLVMFGGEKEVTLSDGHICNAIVTTNPGLVLNGGEPLTGNIMVGIALTGTVPVNVVGDVKKFDKLVPSSKFRGYARRRHWYDFFRRTIGMALTDSKGGQVECITKMEF